MKRKKIELSNILPNEMVSALKIYYNRLTLTTIEERLYKKLQKQARELADEIIKSYDFKQYYSVTLGDKIIITSILTKKSNKNAQALT